MVRVVDEISLRLRTAREAISSVPAKLGQHQTAALRIAFRGDATGAWRCRAGIDDTKDILESLRAAGGNITVPRSDLAAAFDVRPETDWPFVTLGSACDPARSITYGIIQTGDESENGVPTVRAGDIKNFNVELSSLKRVRREIADRYPRTALRGGEVIISIRGTTGNVAVVGSEMTGMNVSREVAVIPLLPKIEPKYVAYALASPGGQAIIMSHVKGVAQTGINLSDLREFPLPLPRHAEQLEIVKFLDDVLSHLSELGERVHEIERSLDQLREATLQVAFRGELTLQSPDDEPAMLLLQRLRSSRAIARPRRRAPRVENLQRDLFRKQDMQKTRKDVQDDYLRTIIRQANARSLAVKELYLRAEMNIDEFYKQLAHEIALGWLRESADKARLELADAA